MTYFLLSYFTLVLLQLCFLVLETSIASKYLTYLNKLQSQRGILAVQVIALLGMIISLVLGV